MLIYVAYTLLHLWTSISRSKINLKYILVRECQNKISLK